MPISLSVVRAELDAVVQDGASGRSTADALCASCVGLLDVDGVAVSLVHDGASSGAFGSSGEESRRLDEYQFTFGEGPCLDAVASRRVVLAPDLDSPEEQRWPVFADAVLADGIRGVFALPIMITSVCVGALDLFRAQPGPLDADVLAGALVAAELASAPLLDLMAEARDDGLDERSADEHRPGESTSTEMERVEVYQATGMLIAALDVDASEALLRLRAHALATGQTASEVARAIVERRLVIERDYERPGGDGSR